MDYSKFRIELAQALGRSLKDGVILSPSDFFKVFCETKKILHEELYNMATKETKVFISNLDKS